MWLMHIAMRTEPYFKVLGDSLYNGNSWFHYDENTQTRSYSWARTMKINNKNSIIALCTDKINICRIKEINELKTISVYILLSSVQLLSNAFNQKCWFPVVWKKIVVHNTAWFVVKLSPFDFCRIIGNG